MKRIHAFGGLAGAMLAAAGGIGAAVGVYTLPAPDSASVMAEAYAQAVQRAFVASTLREDEFSRTLLRIEVLKGATKLGGHADTESGEPNTDVYQNIGAELRAEIRTCSNDGACLIEREWSGPLPNSAFRFAVTMDAAEVDAEVQGCRFHVAWHPEGDIGPFESHTFESRSDGGEHPGRAWEASGSMHAGVFAEASRIAQADITLSPRGSCDPYGREGAPGYLTQGASVGPVNAGYAVE